MFPELTALLATLAVASAAKTAHLPSAFKRCSLSDPSMNDCLKSAVQVAIPELVKGVPSLGVYPIDPLDILEADIGASEGPVALNLNFRKLKIGGLNTAKVLSVTFDPKAHHMKMKVNVTAPLRLDGHYKVAGRVLVLPIQGDGPCSLRLDNVTAHLDIKGQEVTKGGHKFMEVEKLDLSFDTSRLHMRFDNLFNGNKELGDNMNKFLNENWPEILHELKPSIDQTFGNAFQAIANRIFLRVPYNSVFLS